MAKKKYVFWLALGILSVMAAAKTVSLQSRWQETPIQVDGDIGDWMAPCSIRKNRCRWIMLFATMQTISI